jgi:hypothetical protein
VLWRYTHIVEVQVRSTTQLPTQPTTHSHSRRGPVQVTAKYWAPELLRSISSALEASPQADFVVQVLCVPPPPPPPPSPLTHLHYSTT